MKVVSQLENINQALFELNPHDDDPEHWMEDTLAPVEDIVDPDPEGDQDSYAGLYLKP